jgi:hypothetical protein
MIYVFHKRIRTIMSKFQDFTTRILSKGGINTGELFKFVLWYTLFLFCVEFKIVLYQFLYWCGHFNLSLIANQTISDSFLEMYRGIHLSFNWFTFF